MDDPRQPDTTQFEVEESSDSSRFEKLIGLKIESSADGEAGLTMPFTVKMANGGGVIHGDAMTSLAHTAVTIAIKNLLPSGTTFAMTGLIMEILTPVISGVVYAYARVKNTGERSFEGACELSGESRQIYAVFTSVSKV